MKKYLIDVRMLSRYNEIVIIRLILMEYTLIVIFYFPFSI